VAGRAGFEPGTNSRKGLRGSEDDCQAFGSENDGRPTLTIAAPDRADIYREVSLVSMPGRRFSPAVAAFVKTVNRYRWRESPS
jgi:hypothetical protein